VVVTITLPSPAPPGGAIIYLSSSDPQVTVPAFVIVPAGATSVTVTITVGTAVGPDDVQITATSASAVSTILRTVAVSIP
jgi:hypothetical protein